MCSFNKLLNLSASVKLLHWTTLTGLPYQGEAWGRCCSGPVLTPRGGTLHPSRVQRLIGYITAKNISNPKSIAASLMLFLKKCFSLLAPPPPPLTLGLCYNPSPPIGATGICVGVNELRGPRQSGPQGGVRMKWLAADVHVTVSQETSAETSSG